VAAAQIVHDVAVELRAKPGQIALAWLLSKGAYIAPIPGTKRRSYLEENVAAASISLSPRHVNVLDVALNPSKVAGPRYGAAMMAMVDRT
jgi:aryl-alcohol dehydrogenase-like predicted oxidoreductase